MIDVLTPIWRRVLQVESVGIEDNFFDLGGDSSLAVALFNEIAEVCGREMPPVMIYHAPTITALSALLESPTTPRFPPLVLLKAGTKEPPVFFTHGLGGSVIDFYQVVRLLDTPHSVQGMQSRGIDGVDAPFDRIEDMADFYLDSVREIQPHGPYLLVGFSLGGLVTFEMARRLTAKGEEVALLAMLDSYPNISYLSWKQRVLLTLQQTRYRVSEKLIARTNMSKGQVMNDATQSAAQRKLRESAYLALERYEPKFYPGKINFVRAAIPTTFPRDAYAVWRYLAREVSVDTVSGDHLGIMTTHYDQLAGVISGYLREFLR